MAINLQITRLPVPELEFAGSGYYTEPRRGLLEAGPFDMRFGSAHRTQVRLAVVGSRDILDQAIQWFERCQKPIHATTSQGGVAGYPGFSAIFRSELVAGSQYAVSLDKSRVDRAMAMKPYDGFKEIVRVYVDAIQQAKRDFRPDVVVCCIPEQIEKRFWMVHRSLTREEQRAIKAVAAQQEAFQFELPLDWEPEENVEDLYIEIFDALLKPKRCGLRCQFSLRAPISLSILDLMKKRLFARGTVASDSTIKREVYPGGYETEGRKPAMSESHSITFAQTNVPWSIPHLLRHSRQMEKGLR